eukprot:13541434-Alexandrium_andersonii.AAC.1
MAASFLRKRRTSRPPSTRCAPACSPRQLQKHDNGPAPCLHVGDAQAISCSPCLLYTSPSPRD